MGEYSTAEFGEGVTPDKKRSRDYVTVNIKGLGKRTIRKLEPKEVKRDIALSTTIGAGGGLLGAMTKKGGFKAKLVSTVVGGGIGAGGSMLYHKNSRFSKDIDGRSDKGKKRKYR